MPRVPVAPIPDKELSHRPGDDPVTALPLRHSPEPVNCTAVFDVLKPLPQRPPDHDWAPRVRPVLPGVLKHPETADEAAEFERSARFGPVEFRRYEWQQTYTANEYLNLLMTYSGHRAMEPQARSDLFACITHLIDNVYNGQLTKQYRTRLAIAYKTQ